MERMLFLSSRRKREGRALLAAIEALQVEEVRRLLAAGVSPRRQWGWFWSLESPLVLSARRGSLELVRLLVEAGVPVDEQRLFGYHVNGLRALDWACFYEHIDLIEFLLSRGAYAGVFDNGVGYIQEHDYYTNPRIIRLLLDYGANGDNLMKVHYFRMPLEILTMLMQASKQVPPDVQEIWEALREIEAQQRAKQAGDGPAE